MNLSKPPAFSNNHDVSGHLPYNIPALPVLIRKESLYDYPSEKSFPHWHDDFEVVVIKSGRMKLIANGTCCELNEKDLCIISSGCVHYFDSVNEENCVYYVGLINESLFCSAEEIRKKYIIPMYHSHRPDYEIIFRNNPLSPQIYSVLMEIWDLLYHKKLCWELFLAGKLHEYLGLIVQATGSEDFIHGTLSTENSESLRTILSYIHQNYSQKILVEDLLAVGNLSRKQFYTLFEQYTGKKPGTYLTKYRLSMACAFLQDPDYPISQIALDCGFTHQSHFTNTFARHIGSTPKQYRDSVLKNCQQESI